MADYKRGFLTIAETLSIEVCKHFDDDSYYHLDCNTDDTSISEEDGNCIIQCLNAKPDSMEKIIEEFKKLGYKQDEMPEEYDTTFAVAFSCGEITLCILKNDFQKCELDLDGYFFQPKEITIKELQLINRIYRLWGVEV